MAGPPATSLGLTTPQPTAAELAGLLGPSHYRRTVPQLEQARYVGDWWCYAFLPGAPLGLMFQHPGSTVLARYTPEPGGFRVDNYEWLDDGSLRHAKAHATPDLRYNEPGKFVVSFMPLARGTYWVLELGPATTPAPRPPPTKEAAAPTTTPGAETERSEAAGAAGAAGPLLYDWSVVGSEHDAYLWILVRQPTTPLPYDAIVKRLEQQHGYSDIARRLFVDHPNPAVVAAIAAGIPPQRAWPAGRDPRHVEVEQNLEAWHDFQRLLKGQ
jgi:lipocalin